MIALARIYSPVLVLAVWALATLLNTGAEFLWPTLLALTTADHIALTRRLRRDR